MELSDALKGAFDTARNRIVQPSSLRPESPTGDEGAVGGRLAQRKMDSWKLVSRSLQNREIAGRLFDRRIGEMIYAAYIRKTRRSSSAQAFRKAKALDLIDR